MIIRRCIDLKLIFNLHAFPHLCSDPNHKTQRSNYEGREIMQLSFSGSANRNSNYFNCKMPVDPIYVTWIYVLSLNSPYNFTHQNWMLTNTVHSFQRFSCCCFLSFVLSTAAFLHTLHTMCVKSFISWILWPRTGLFCLISYKPHVTSVLHVCNHI